MVDEYSSSDAGDAYDDSDPIAAERCAHPQRLDGGAMCGEPADMHCPICRVALCYSCAAEHCDQAAPMCSPPASTSTVSEHRADT